jgi:hypothetical protein
MFWTNLVQDINNRMIRNTEEARPHFFSLGLAPAYQKQRDIYFYKHKGIRCFRG